MGPPCYQFVQLFTVVSFALGCPWKLVTIVSKLVYFAYLRDLQSTSIGVIIYLLSTVDIAIILKPAHPLSNPARFTSRPKFRGVHSFLLGGFSGVGLTVVSFGWRWIGGQPTKNGRKMDDKSVVSLSRGGWVFRGGVRCFCLFFLGIFV